MALQPIVETLDSVDESLQSHYVEGKSEDGSTFYKLDVTEQDGYALEDISRLKSAAAARKQEREEVKRELSTVKAQLKPFEGVDLDDLVSTKAKYETLVPEYEQLKSFNPESEAERIAEEKYKAEVARKATELQEEYEPKINDLLGKTQSLEETNTRLFQQLERVTVDSALMDAIVKAGPLDGMAEDVRTLLKSNVHTIHNEDGSIGWEVRDQNGLAMVNNKGEDYSLTNLVKDFKKNKPAYWKAPGQSGMGSQKSGEQKGSKEPVDTMSAMAKAAQALKDKSKR